jgi:hypothetical protein
MYRELAENIELPAEAAFSAQRDAGSHVTEEVQDKGIKI